MKFIPVLTLAVCALAQAQTGGSITLSPAAMTINYQIGSTKLPAAQTLSVQTKPQGLNFTISVSGAPFDAEWLLVSAVSGTSPASIKVEANPTGLAAGAYAATITVTAISGGQTLQQTATVTLLVASAAPSVTTTPASLNFSYTTGDSITSPSLSNAFILSSSGAAVSATLTVSGAPWLTLSPSGGISLIGLLNTVSVTVNPTGLAPKAYTGQIKISAPAATNKTIAIPVTLTVSAAVPSVTGVWPPGVIQGSDQTVATIEGAGYFSNSTVAVSGFTPASTITVTDGTNTATETVFIPAYSPTANALRMAVASPLPTGVVNAAYSQTLAAAGGTAPYSYAVIDGNPPPGVAIGGSQLSGTPTGAGTFLFTVQVSDSSTPPIQAYNQFTLRIDPAGATALRVTGSAAPLPIGTVGAAYGPVTLAASGGVSSPTYTWSATNLPPGLTLSAAGVLSGTPSTDGSGGAIAASVVSENALLATVPSADLSEAGVLRMEVTTPAPGGGISNEAQFQVYGPEPQINAVVNSASFAQGTMAPGDLITIFGLGLGPSTLTVFDPSSPPIPVALPAVSPSTSVTINGIAAPVLYTSATQVGVIVPYAVTGANAQVVATYGGIDSQPFTVAVAAADPGIYSTASSGQGQGAILNYNSTTGNYTINANSNAAARGSIIVIYITGAGATTSTVDDQLIPSAPAVTPLLTPTVTIGGQGATVLGAQAPPGSVPGLIQLNVTVPSTLKPGQALPVVVTIGGVDSQAGLTMAVR